jgi:hypothetical protein
VQPTEDKRGTHELEWSRGRRLLILCASAVLLFLGCMWIYIFLFLSEEADHGLYGISAGLLVVVFGILLTRLWLWAIVALVVGMVLLLGLCALLLFRGEHGYALMYGVVALVYLASLGPALYARFARGENSDSA